MTEAEWKTEFEAARARFLVTNPGRFREALEYAFRSTPPCPSEFGADTPAWVKFAIISLDTLVTALLIVPAVTAATPGAKKLAEKLSALYKAAQSAGVAPDLAEDVVSGAGVIVMYDWKKSLKKAAVQLGIAAAAGAAGVIASGVGLEGIKDMPVVGPVLAGIIIAGATWVVNWAKNRNGAAPIK